jgi:Flp pilus assembly protein CpaB
LRQSHVLLIATITCVGGFFLGFMFGGYQSKRAFESKLVPVVVAAQDLPVGTLINDPDKQLKNAPFPRDNLPPGAVQSPEELRGKFLAWAIYKGSPVTTQALSVSGDTWGRRPPPGVRAITIRLAKDTARELPGSFVDVIAKVPDLDEPGKFRTKVIVENVMVLAVATGKDDPHVITIAVIPEQVEPLLEARQHGTFSLTLRKPAE